MNISFVGAGNVALSLASAFRMARHRIVHIYAPTREHAVYLAETTGASAVSSVAEVAHSSDFVILAVPDASIENVADKLSQTSAIVLHISGSTGLEALKSCGKNCGVLYPLQTFSKSCLIDDFSAIPVLVESESDAILQKIISLARTISKQVFTTDLSQRRSLHIAAVFACNFVNLLLTEAFDICKESQVDPHLLEALVNETVRKAFASGNPSEVQTGPARRGDRLTVEKHLLSLNYEQKKIYSALTESIFSKYKVKI
ncbi:MAG: DUF2520 domain-containing protein [Prevotellaceae bacterium]|jgi:predicted short-subunit dehydrogenase-like oxidoreductase (DUF2520 family)|nr:DUF2520 domain-containing protein [Prevotellaceae bacterium]